MSSGLLDVRANDRAVLEAVKISSLSYGVAVTSPAMDVLRRLQGGLLSLHEYPTTGGVTLELPHEVYVNAPFDEDFCALAEVTLDCDADAGLFLRLADLHVPVVRQLPLPGYLDVVGRNGLPIREVVMSHGDRARLSPIDGCAYDCAFCDMAELPYVRYDAEFLTEALAIARQDPVLPVRHGLISGGSPRARHYDDFEQMAVQVIGAAGMPMDLMMSPMVNNDGIVDRLKAAGLADFSINIEVYSGEAALAALGMKYRTSRRHFERFATRAVAACEGSGEVRSLIIVGLEDPDQTIAGVEYLAGLGITPVLSPFRPAKGTAFADRQPVPPEVLRRILERSREIVDRHGLRLGPGCTACQHNTLSFPWEGRR